MHLFFTREGYFKKIQPNSLRMSGEQKLKEGDEILQQTEAPNSAELLFFTNQCQVYKCKASDFGETKASVLGEYLPSAMGMDEGEKPVYMAVVTAYEGHMLFVYENGKCARVPIGSYETKQNRKKLLKAYSDKSALFTCMYLPQAEEIALQTSAGRLLLVGSAQISEIGSRSSGGVSVITLKKNQKLVRVRPASGMELKDPHRYRARNLPAVGAVMKEEDTQEQLTLL